MAEGTKVGEAYVSLEADSSGLTTGLKAGEAQVEQFAATADKATARSTKGFIGLGKGIRDTIKPLTSLVGGVTAAIGTFGLFVSLGERLGRVLTGLDQQGRTQDEAARETLESRASRNLGKRAGINVPDVPRGEMTKEEAAQSRLYQKIAALESEIRRLQVLTPIGERERRRKGFTSTDPSVLALGDPAGPSIRDMLSDIPWFGRLIPTDARAENRRRQAARRGISRGQLQIEEAQYELSNIRETIARDNAGMRPIVKPPSRAPLPLPIGGLSGGGDPNVLRMLQSIDRQLQRRGIDQ